MSIKLIPEHCNISSSERTVHYVARIDELKSQNVILLKNTIDTELLLDKSGSMQGKPLDMLKESSIIFINDKSLTCNDRIGVCSFSNVFNIVSQLSPVINISIEHIDPKQKLIDAIKNITADGTTDIYGSLYNTLDELLKNKSSNIQNIILFSDGQHNCQTSHTLEEIVKMANKSNIIIHCIGSDGHDTMLMSSIAKQTGGLYISITDFEQISGAIAAIVDCMQTIICSDLVIELRLLNEARFIKDKTVCSFPFEFQEFSSMNDSENSFASGLCIELGRYCINEKREFAFAVKYPDDVMIHDSIISNIMFSHIITNTKTRNLDVLPSSVVCSDVGIKEYSPDFCKTMLNIITASAMSQALNLEKREALNLLESTIEQINQKYKEYNTYSVLISEDELKLIIDDITIAINDLERGRLDSFNNAAISFSSQSPAGMCVASERITSVDMYRTHSERVKSSEYTQSKQSLRQG
jgi:uncharacterized protein YegL